MAAFIARRGPRAARTVRDPTTGALRPSRAGDVMVLAPRLTQVPLPRGRARRRRRRLRGGRRQVVLQPPGGARGAGHAARDRRPLRPRVAGGRAALVVLRRQRPRHRAYALAPAGGWRLGAGADASLPGGARSRPRWSCCARCTASGCSVSVPALLERLYDRTRVLAALTGTRRGEARIANLEKVVALARQAGDLGVLTLRGFTRLLADAHQRRRARSRTCPPRGRAIPAPCASCPSTRPRAWRRRSWCSTTWPPACARGRGDRAVGRGQVAVGFRAGCRPPDWNALAERDEARARAEGRRLLYVACTRARDLLVMPRPPATRRSATSGGTCCRSSTRAPPTRRAGGGRGARCRAPARPRDALGPARAGRRVGRRRGRRALGAEREARSLEAGGYRPLRAHRGRRRRRRERARRAVRRRASPSGGRDFGSLVHRMLEWIPLDDATRGAAAAMAARLAPSFGLDADGGGRARPRPRARALRLPVMERARAAPRVLARAAAVVPRRERPDRGRRRPRLRGGRRPGDRGLQDRPHRARSRPWRRPRTTRRSSSSTAAGWPRPPAVPVRERLVLFTALGQAVPV